MSPSIESYAGTFPGRIAYHYKIIAVHQIPAEVSAVFGDAVHNLRAALDFIAYDVTPKNDGNRRFTGFPFHETAENFYRDINQGRLSDIPEHLKNVFRSVEAFRGGKGDALWQMNKLDIIDKHRMLIASEFITGLEIPTPISLGSDSFTGRLSNRQPDGYLLITDQMITPNAETALTFEVVIAEDEHLVDRPLISALGDLRRQTIATIDDFERALSEELGGR